MLAFAACSSAPVTSEPSLPPPMPPEASIASLALTPSEVLGGAVVIGTVTLDGPAPFGGAVVTLASSSESAISPGTVTVIEGQVGESFAVVTAAVTGTEQVTVTATYRGVNASGTFVIAVPLPPPPPPPPVCHRPPVASVQAPIEWTVEIEPGQAVTFAGTCDSGGEAGVKHAWGFEGGSPQDGSVGTPGAVTYPSSGIFTATYACSSDGGDSNAVVRTIVVAAPPISKWFVDSRLGDDANDGRSETTPLRTITALRGKSLEAGSAVYLARGSMWREELSRLPDRVSVKAHGQGERPILDAADVGPNSDFTKTTGRANVFELSWRHELRSGNKVKHSVWEDGARLVRVADLAACDATPGSFFAPVPDTVSGLDVIYVHASDDSSVPSNGKLYELARREYGLFAATGGQVIGIHTRRNGHNDGSLVSKWYARDCLAEDGTMHNFWVEGLAEDCIAWKNDLPPNYGGATLFVTYATGGGTGVVYRRCRAIGSSTASVIGYYIHTAGGAAMFDRAVYDQCEAENVAAGFAASDVRQVVYRGFKARTTTFGIQNYAPGLVVLGGDVDDNVDAPTLYTAIKIEVPATTRIRGVRFVARRAHPGLIWARGPVDVAQSTFSFVKATGWPLAAFWATEGSLALHRNVVAGAAELFEISEGVTLASDFNVVDRPGLWATVGATTFKSFAAYQGGTGQDGSSVAGDPLFVAPGATVVQDASPACPLRAGADFWGDGPDAPLLSLP